MSDVYLEKLKEHARYRHLFKIYILVLAIFCVSFAWVSTSSYLEARQTIQNTAAKQATETANDLSVYFFGLKRSLQVFFDNRHSQIAQVYADPFNSEVIIEGLKEEIREYFSEFQDLNLATSSGNLLLDDFQEVFGPQCRKDMFGFVQHQNQVIRLHPQNGFVHFDLQLSVTINNKDIPLLLLFDINQIADILERQQTQYLDMILVETERQDKIAISAHGHRLENDNPDQLSEAQLTLLEQLGSRLNLEGTVWQILAVPRDQQISQLRYGFILQISMIMLAFVGISAITFYFNRRELQLRMEAQNQLFMANLLLEESVQERTEELVKSSELNRITFEQASIAIGHVALNGDLLKVNRAFCDYLFYNEPVLLKKTWWILAMPLIKN